MSAAQQVLDAANALMAAFSRNDTEAYFASFSEDASFVFHSHGRVLPSRAAYRALWEDWQREGFEVLSAVSSNQQVSLQGELAIFIHDVATHARLQGQEMRNLERETIVFRRQPEQGRWLACHEHLSVMPEQWAPI